MSDIGCPQCQSVDSSGRLGRRISRTGHRRISCAGLHRRVLHATFRGRRGSRRRGWARVVRGRVRRRHSQQQRYCEAAYQSTFFSVAARLGDSASISKARMAREQVSSTSYIICAGTSEACLAPAKSHGEVDEVTGRVQGGLCGLVRACAGLCRFMHDRGSGWRTWAKLVLWVRFNTRRPSSTIIHCDVHVSAMAFRPLLQQVRQPRGSYVTPIDFV